MALSGSDYGNCVVGKGSEVGNGGIDICGFVDADKRFVEDGEEVAEEVECYGLFREFGSVDAVKWDWGTHFFDYAEHHSFVSLAGVHL